MPKARRSYRAARLPLRRISKRIAAKRDEELSACTQPDQRGVRPHDGLGKGYGVPAILPPGGQGKGGPFAPPQDTEQAGAEQPEGAGLWNPHRDPGGLIIDDGAIFVHDPYAVTERHQARDLPVAEQVHDVVVAEREQRPVDIEEPPANG